MKETPHTIDEMMAMTPMKCSDAVAQLKRKVSPNERPYEKETIELNNALVDTWDRTVLTPNSKKGKLPAGSIHPHLVSFLVGRDIKSFMQYRSMLVEYPEEKVMFWINLFKNASIKDLHAMGPAVVSMGWGLIFNAISSYSASLKYEKIYSKTDDPAQWAKIAADNQQVFRGDLLPFGLDQETMLEMEAKVMAILKISIEPK